MPEDLHPNTDSAAAPDEEAPVEQLIERIKSSRDTADTADAAQELIEQSRRRRNSG